VLVHLALADFQPFSCASNATGHYSYWSQRAGNREPNRGLRLDYFVCHSIFFDESSNVVARDSYIDPDQLGSDHCPVILELEIKTVLASDKDAASSLPT
jgi:exonuclease III